MMDICFIGTNVEVVDAWHQHPFRCADVTIEQGDILDAHVGCIVSPANSFCLMDGGLDLAIAKRWPNLMAPAMEVIVGSSLCFYTDDNPVKAVIAAPTMRVPMRLHARTVNPYLASKAALQMARQLDFSCIAIPGMGAGVGGVPPKMVARQMWLAVKHFRDPPPHPQSSREAKRAHVAIYSDTSRSPELDGE